MKKMLQCKAFCAFLFVLAFVFFNFKAHAENPKKLPPLPAGTYTIGSGGTYTSTITAALATIQSGGGISGPIVLELLSTYSPPASAEILTTITGASATNTITIRPAAGVSKTLTSTSGTAAGIEFNGARFFIIDGQATGSSGTKDLTIRNTTGGWAVRLRNDATDNIIKNCNLLGQGAALANSIVLFSTANSGSGNDNNTINNCFFSGNGGTNLPACAIYSSGQATKANNDNNITNNVFADIFRTAAKAVAISLEAHTNSWTIEGNSFYLTAARSSTSQWSAIEVNNKTNGFGHKINGNYIGGNTALAASGTSSFSFTGSGVFQGISIIGGTATDLKNEVTNNVFKNLSTTCNLNNIHALIFHSDGPVDINNNAIGDLTSTGSIVFNSGTTPTAFVSPALSAICAGGGSVGGTVGGAVNIKNNTIGSITSNDTRGVPTATSTNEVRGIFYQCPPPLLASPIVPAIVEITGNTIGGTVANSISNNGNGATVGIVINSAYAAGATPHIVSNNTIQNLTASNTSTIVRGSLEGITTQSRSYPGGTATDYNTQYTVENNIVRDLTVNNKYTMVGMKIAAVQGVQIIRGNLVYNLENSNTNLGANVVGIETTDYSTAAIPAGTSELSKNIVRNLQLTGATTDPNSVVWGFSINGGRFNVFNNMIALGYTKTNTSIIKNYEIKGISSTNNYNSKAYDINYYYNTVHIGGTGVSAGSYGTFALFCSNPTASVVNIKNNILYNSRSNGAGTGSHYGFYYTAGGTYTSDYNAICAVGTGGIVANYNGTNYATVDLFSVARSIDQNSFSAPIKFINDATNLRLAASPDDANFIVSNEAIPIAGYTTDIDGNTRHSFFPDMGCFEFRGTGSWFGGLSSAWDNNTVGGNWDDGVIPTSTHKVKIFPSVDPSLSQPIITSAMPTATVNDLYVRTTTRTTTNSSFVTVSGGMLAMYGVIDWRKNVEYNGVIDAVNGTVDMRGTSAQTLKPRWFVKTEIETLTNSNSVGLIIAAKTVNDTMLISKTLDYGVGLTGSTITTNNNVTLLSRATRTANFGNITGNAIVGNVTVERFIPATRKWRLLSWPTNSTQTAKQSLMEGATVPNANPNPRYGCIVTDERAAVWGPGGFDSRSISGPSVKYYNSSTDTYEGIPNVHTYQMNSKTVYYNFVRGDRSCLPLPYTNSTTVLRTTGTLKTGNQVYSVAAGNFEAIGNPYASAIDIRGIDTSGLTGEFYVWDPQLTGAFGLGAYQTLYKSGSDYRIMPGGGSYPPLNTIVDTLESGSGFFVRARGSGGTVTVKETAKTIGARTFTRGAGTPQAEQLFALLHIEENGVSTLVDGCMAAYDNIYSNDVDFDDALKLSNTNENAGFKRNNSLLAIERRKDIESNDTLYLNLTSLRVKTYKWNVKLNHMQNTGRTAFLVDRYAQVSTPLNLHGETSYQFNVINLPASYDPARFIIVFNQIPQPKTVFVNVKATRQTGTNVKLDFAVNNEVNIASYEIEHSLDGINFTNIGTKAPMGNTNNYASYEANHADANDKNNWYRIKLTNNAGGFAYSTVVMVAAKEDNNQNHNNVPTASINPNPVVDGKLNLVLTNYKAGLYNVSIVNAVGQQVYNGTIKLQSNDSVHPINISNAAQGTYYLVLKAEDGMEEKIYFFSN
jgi:Secretion system C-terminal sorting domain